MYVGSRLKIKHKLDKKYVSFITIIFRIIDSAHIYLDRELFYVKLYIFNTREAFPDVL